MNLQVQQTAQLTGQVMPPASKSHSIRALMLALMATGDTHLSHALLCDDTLAAISVCRQLGADIVLDVEPWQIMSPGLPLTPLADEIYTGNSGVTTHFVMPLLGLRQDVSRSIVVDCGEQMRARPVKPLIDALLRLGMTVEYVQQPGQLPLRVTGPLRGGAAQIDGTTSQYVSALLMALPCAVEDSELTVQHLCERPYVDMTLQWLTSQGIRYEHQRFQDLDVYRIPGRQRYAGFAAAIAADFSSASYLIAASVLLPGRVTLTGLDWQDAQGDKQFVTLLQTMGAHIRLESHGLVIDGGHPLRGITIDARDIPDLLPVLAVIGTQATEMTRITDVPHARIKETDRIASMCAGLSRLGARIEAQPDGLIVYPSRLQGCQVQGCGDHRTVMALAVAGLIAQGTTWISDGQSIQKTFPTFVEQLQALGARVDVR